MLSKLLQYYVRHFPIDRGKNRAISLLWKPLSIGQTKAREARLRQGNVKVSCDLQQLIQRQLYFWGSYEKEYCELWIRLAKAANTVFDVGANVGVYSLLAAEANPAAQIHAFEPSGQAIDVFRANITLNGFSNITVNASAVGKKTGQAVLRECRGSDGTNEGMDYLVNFADMGAADRSVDLTSLDDYTKAHGVGRVDLMKIDIEGGEYDALIGAKTLLQTNSIGCLFIECTEWAAQRSGHAAIDLINLLLDVDYSLYQLTPRGLKGIEVENIREGENLMAFSPLDKDWVGSLLAERGWSGATDSLLEH